MIIEEIKIDSDTEDGNHLIVTGRSLESILERRIIWGQRIFSGNLQNAIQTMLNENIISPSIADRKIPNFTFKASTDSKVTGLTIDNQYTGDDLYTVIKGLCEENNIGFKIILTDDNKFEFCLYAGADRSYDQTENPYVVFSPNFENIINSNYYSSKANLKNVTLVAGEGEGASRKTTVVGSGSGLDRRELFTDARDISSDTEDGQLPENEYIAQLTAKGEKNLADHDRVTAFEGEVEVTRLFKYGEDFFIGDIVQIANEYGNEGSAYISELIISRSKDKQSIYPTYNAEQVSSLFDGLIIDGVFASVGTAFAVKATTGITVNVGIGKAWFNHTWTLNDSILPLEAPEAEVLLDRIDAVVLEVDATESVRANSIKFVKGTPSSAPSNPTLTNEGTVHQYPLCYIYRKFGSSAITQADITNMVGTESTPFVTAMLQTISLDELLGQWQSELDQFVDARQDEVDQWIASEESDFTEWFDQMKADLQAEQTLLDQWVATEQADFLAWYNQMKDQLGEDAAGNLQNQINKDEIKRILLVGFEDGTKEFSEDGTVITSTASDGRILTKTFTNGFLTMTSVLKSAAGAEVARAVKTFNTDGSLISTVVTYS